MPFARHFAGVEDGGGSLTLGQMSTTNSASASAFEVTSRGGGGVRIPQPDAIFAEVAP